MLGPEKPNGKINQRHIQRAEDGHDCGDDWSFSASRKSAKNEIADVNQPQHEGRGQTNVAGRPLDSPHRSRPYGAGDDDNRAEDHSDLSADQRENVGLWVTTNEVNDRRNKIDEEQHERSPGRWHVVIKDAL